MIGKIIIGIIEVIAVLSVGYCLGAVFGFEPIVNFIGGLL